MPNTLGSFDPQNITLHVSKDSAAGLDPRWSLRKVMQDYGVNQEITLIVKTIPAEGNNCLSQNLHRHLLRKDLVLK